MAPEFHIGKGWVIMDVDFRGLQERLRQRVLKEIREGKLTGVQLARAAGFRQAHISNFLNSKRGLSLEAMDAILLARGWKLADLAPECAKPREGRMSLKANSPGVSWIPLVDAKNCHAREVPYEATKNALRVMSSRLEKMPEVSPNVRGSWLRFVAVRVPAEEAEAMAPRLARGSVAIVDRHAYAPGDRRSIYAVRTKATSKIVMRNVEVVGHERVMRAENPSVPLQIIEDLAEIVGRVCFVISEV